MRNLRKFHLIFMQNTLKQYDAIIASCRALFVNKMKDYGSAWRILRLPSLTDQIFIKAQRIRGLQRTTGALVRGWSLWVCNDF